ncbi:MAG TPA: acetyl-coenzyme A synthetase N-terminal domain-containing protein, partial [Candidatus Limnocylindria bacterium]|nr:acetyl-coenzyme A synthetase N-terminal domain-containing protein [Candidatus Limnocylindria bacterium]
MTTEERTDEHRDRHPGQEHVEATIENLLREERIFPPSLAFKEQANVNDVSIYDRARSDEGFRAFWTEEAKRIDWIEPWTELLDWQ